MAAMGKVWWAALLIACGTSPTTSGVDAESAGKGGTAGSGGSPPLILAGSGGAQPGSAGTTHTGGMNTSGGIGADWPQEDFGPVPPGTECAQYLSVIEGEVGGQKFSNGYRAFPHLSTFSSWWYSWLAPHGKTQIFTKAPQMGGGFFDPESDLTPGQAYAVRGWLSLDSEGPDPNAVYCLNEGSTLTAAEKMDRQQALELDLAFSKLGSCPGQPVSGDLSFCYGVNADDSCPQGVVGELEGAPLTTTLQGIVPMTGVGAASEDVATFLFGERWLRLRFPMTGGALEGGLLLTAETSFELTEAYCLDAGTVTSFGSSSYKIEVTSISKLGACSNAEVAGSARVCTVFND